MRNRAEKFGIFREIDTKRKIFGEGGKVSGNRLKDIRIAEGLTITELARLSNLSTKIISQTERFLTEPTEVTKRKIVNGLNAAKRAGQKPYSFEYIFFQEEGTKAPEKNKI